MKFVINAMTPNLYRAQLYVFLMEHGSEQETGHEGQTTIIDVPGSATVVDFAEFLAGRFKVQHKPGQKTVHLIPLLNRKVKAVFNLH